MCTLTFFKSQDGSIFITSNRDESPKRQKALFPQVYHHYGIHCLYPKDPEGKGSWFVVTEAGICGVILNAADTAYQRNPPYRKSRGLVLLDICMSANLSMLPDFYNFNGIEPFTAILFDLHSENILEFKWRGDECFINGFSFDKPLLWASANLFSKTDIKHKETSFFNQLKSAEICDRDSIIKFHQQKEADGGICDNFLDRPFVKTCSITSLVVRKRKMNLVYQDTSKMNNISNTELVIKS